jgi:hypothetical protein
MTGRNARIAIAVTAEPAAVQTAETDWHRSLTRKQSERRRNDRREHPTLAS